MSAASSSASGQRTTALLAANNTSVRLRRHRVDKQRKYWLVMTNVLSSKLKIHEKYDLKGSTGVLAKESLEEEGRLYPARIADTARGRASFALTQNTEPMKQAPGLFYQFPGLFCCSRGQKLCIQMISRFWVT